MASLSMLYLLVIGLATQAHSFQPISQQLVNFIKENSDPAVIPQTSMEKPVNVSVRLDLQNIRNVDFVTKDVEMDAWMFLTWNSGLTFDPADFNNLEQVRVPSSYLWRPDMELYNGKIIFQEHNLSDYAVCDSKGEVIWVPKVTLRATCDVTQHDIFFNSTCELKVGSWTYSGQFISLNENPSWEVGTYFAGSSFEVLNVSAKKHSVSYSCCPENYEDIMFSVSFKKKSLI